MGKRKKATFTKAFGQIRSSNNSLAKIRASLGGKHYPPKKAKKHTKL